MFPDMTLKSVFLQKDNAVIGLHTSSWLWNDKRVISDSWKTIYKPGWAGMRLVESFTETVEELEAMFRSEGWVDYVKNEHLKGGIV